MSWFKRTTKGIRTSTEDKKDRPSLEHGEDVAAPLKANETVSVSAGVVATLALVRKVERPALTHPHLNVAEGLAKVAGALLDLPRAVSP